MEPTNNRSFRPLVLIGCLVVFIACGYIIVDAAISMLTTGVLSVNSSNKNATFTISEASSEAKIIGNGATKVRLKPGSYLVVSSDSGKQATAVVKIQKNKTLSIALDPSASSVLPAVGNISFTGVDEFTSHGLSETQVMALKQAFFDFQPSTKSVVVYPNSIKPGPRNPATDVGFNVSFISIIDSKTYNTSIYYSDLNNVRLTINDPVNGKLLYNSDAPNP